MGWMISNEDGKVSHYSEVFNAYCCVHTQSIPEFKYD